ncbi:MAG: hypothetical protein NTV00_16050 [Methylococcales bacterium]|nr:hypothetical protein [Methylococcales bacterium]
MRIIIVVAVLMIQGCSWPHIAMTYGSRYGFNVPGAIYAESKGFKIVDRPDLNLIFVSGVSPPLEYWHDPVKFKEITIGYLNLDRNCEITKVEVMMIINAEYTYKCSAIEDNKQQTSSAGSSCTTNDNCLEDMHCRAKKGGGMECR